MTEPTSAEDLFKGRHFDQEIIVLCVRWYLAFKLSSRDLVQMMAERGLPLAHTMILRWVQRYVPDFEKRKYQPTASRIISGRQSTRRNRSVHHPSEAGTISFAFPAAHHTSTASEFSLVLSTRSDTTVKNLRRSVR